jgi:NhaA family Na+:H+ antiporter
MEPIAAEAAVKPSRLAPILRPVNAFLHAESGGGLALMAATLVALAWANSPWTHGYEQFWHTPVAVGFGELSISMSLAHWVNDGLMAVFFLLVGLEIKRELLIGELASLRHAALPLAAAVGGMVAPALLYLAFNASGPGRAGWGIPMATDIAFAVGVLTIVGRALPQSAKIFLLAIAIVDDLGAVLVIALFYTSGINLAALITAGAFLAVLGLLNLLRVHSPLPYVVLGIGLWFATLSSGLHSTIAGVLLAFTIPATRQIEERPFVELARRMTDVFERDIPVAPDHITGNQSHALKVIEELSQAVQTPLARVEHALLTPVNFLIVPLFALANAGVPFRGPGLGEVLRDPVMWGILVGLVVGKPVGVMVASWLAIKVGVASLPEGSNWWQVLGIAVLCGIGFTMSLFVANLAFPGHADHLAAAKLGILGGSAACGLAGAAIVMAGGRKSHPAN